MKIINHDEDMFLSLRQIDYKFENENIGLRTNNIEFPMDEVNRLIFNRWPSSNNYYLIIDAISKANLQSLINLTPCLKGIVIIADTITKDFNAVLNYAASENLTCYAVLKDPTEDNRVILRDSVYAI